ncbi:MAG: peptide-methionine (R)-S-oxide reductase, partial [Nitrososphaera sp.]
MKTIMRYMMVETSKSTEEVGECMGYNKLTPEQKRVIVDKATEAPFTGEYDSFNEEGTFICRRCNAP